jgi:hypothetical protein
MSKHRIPILDHLYAKGPHLNGGPIPKSVWSMVERAKWNAARYIFDEEASGIAGEFAIHSPEIVIHNRQFAIPPSPLTYVEVRSRPFFSSAKLSMIPENEQDDQLGYLVDGNRVYTFFSRDNDTPGMAYWNYRFAGIGSYAGEGDVKIDLSPEFRQELVDTIPKFEETLGPMAPEQFVRVASMFGSMADGRAYVWNDIKDIASEWAMEYHNHELKKIYPNGLNAMALAGFFGDVRNYVSLMLWLNQPQRVRIVGVPGGRRIVRGKQVPFLHHNTVTISLGGCKTVRRAFIIGNERRHPKLHDVKGHFRHRGGYKPCISLEGHDWPLLPDERGHWVCKTCGRERWHVDKHVRGTAERGVVTKDYSIIP